ncbi:hypothetical protein RFI_25808 [Reticulomyxa filosa]|uniref:Uncharacterized protein n=1 Tax=Reticulomyxa filosa TaxID=46433 RepID=X6MC20_RETFI|nr:hypothetical protein RFI_25808 [Reticulomyxa filosa]|eukprot:ETO11568.1 hypothetical protein RFI_25808 [Reticulomyxa filosa]
MSNFLLRRHFLEYHSRRFKKEIKIDKRKGKFGQKVSNNKAVVKDSSAQNNASEEPSGLKILSSNMQNFKKKKVLGRKMRQMVAKERQQIVAYHHTLAKNLRNNVRAMKLLRVQPSMKGVWENRISLIRQVNCLFICVFVCFDIWGGIHNNYFCENIIILQKKIKKTGP